MKRRPLPLYSLFFQVMSGNGNTIELFLKKGVNFHVIFIDNLIPSPYPDQSAVEFSFSNSSITLSIVRYRRTGLL